MCSFTSPASSSSSSSSSSSGSSSSGSGASRSTSFSGRTVSSEARITGYFNKLDNRITLCVASYLDKRSWETLRVCHGNFKDIRFRQMLAATDVMSVVARHRYEPKTASTLSEIVRFGAKSAISLNFESSLLKGMSEKEFLTIFGLSPDGVFVKALSDIEPQWPEARFVEFEVPRLVGTGGRYSKGWVPPVEVRPQHIINIFRILPLICPKLENMILKDCNNPDFLTAFLRSARETNTLLHLTLGSVECLNAENIAILNDSEFSLTEIHIDADDVNATAMDLIVRLKKLTVFCQRGGTPDGLSRLATCSGVRGVHLRGLMDFMDPSAFRGFISSLSGLRELTICNSPPPAPLDSLPTFHATRDAQTNGTDMELIRVLPDVAPNLQKLCLSRFYASFYIKEELGHHIWPIRYIEELARCPQLQELEIDELSCVFNDTNMPAFALFTRLKELSITSSVCSNIEALQKHLPSNVRLKVDGLYK